MTNELRIADVVGKTYTCEVRTLSGVSIDDAVSLTETDHGSYSTYRGDFPSVSATSNTWYDLIYISDNVVKGSESRYWNGTKLLSVEDTITATGFSTFDASTDEVITDSASRTASQAQGSDIWSYATRTLTSSQSVGSSGSLGTRLEIYTHTTYTNTWSGLTIPADWKEIYFTAKNDPEDQTDSSSVVMVRVSRVASGSDGLQYLNGATSLLTASLTVDQGAGTVILDLSKAVCAEIATDCTLYYDIKLVNDDDSDQLLINPSLVTILSPVKR